MVAQKKIPAETTSIFTADSISSGNTKDILTSFFQLALNNLTGKNKEFNFSSNPFALMVKRNPKLNMDKFYTRNKPLRKLNFNFGIRLDSAFLFNGFSSGIKYSIIDERDPTTSKLLFERLKTDGFLEERTTLNKLMRDSTINKFKASAKTDADFQTQAQTFNSISAFFNNKDSAFKTFGEDFKALVLYFANQANLQKILYILKEHPELSLKENDNKVYEDLKNMIKKCALWTIGISDSTYKDKFEFSNIAIVSEFSKGIFDPQLGDNNLEVNIKTMLDFSNDTIKKSRNLDRKIFSIESGLNWVIRDKTTDQSFFEIKFSGSYYHNFGNLYLNERKDSLTLNGTARIRIINDIWIPLEVKYDPKNGKIFGFLNIKANFSGIGTLLKGKNS